MSYDKPSPLIFLTGEIDGDRDSTSDFAFVRIGASVPIKPSNSSFDLQNPPSQPLAISQRHHLLFVSHSQGFFVANTGDLLEVAKEIKEKGKEVKAVEDVSVVDVKIGRVSTLAVSGDELTLAAVVDGEIFFFSVLSLLNKEQEPSFSCSLSDPGTVKDFKWQKNVEKSFVVLSTHGSLYHGILETELKKIMDNVDAVDWSAEGGFVAVATKHTIIILSSNFKEVLRISVVLESWKPSTDSGSTTRVDSIKWLRDDSIIVGCFQVSEVGDEEGYLVQVIKAKKHNFLEVSCDQAVYSFPDLFDGIWDILPIGCGPYLLASYLDYWEVVLVSNQKAIDQHISLLKWSTVDNKWEVVALEFHSDKYTPKIEVPENDDDNLVLGFCIEKFSSDEKIKIQVDEAFKELSPRYALFCLTSEGKLNLFHAARISEPSDWSLSSQSVDYNDVVKEKQFMASSFEGSIPKLRLKDTAEDATFENLSQQKNTKYSTRTEVKDMVQELDALLLFIEKEGGFKDACTVFQRSSLLALENGLGDLSEMSRICKRKIEVQLLEIQQLQNKMLQVSARQGYMKGLVEQASSKKYWEIWNRQKLNPELEAKRHNILNVNQNLTSEIIELERHFNTLEINRFGESSGTSGHTAFPKGSVPSRQKPSLQSVYNTVNSQIAAAKHLSECLSKQMSELNINSPCVKHKSITKELFESIGLSHEAASSESPVCKIGLTPSPVSPIKPYPGKIAPSVAQALEPETARRRVSLDRTWATFEPPKTTVKRIMQLQRSRISEDRPFRKAKEAFDLEMEAFAIKQKSNDTHVSSSSQYLLNEGTQDRYSKQVIEAPANFVPKWAKDISGSSQILGSKALPVDGTQRSRSSQLISPSVFKSGAQISLKEFCGSPDLSRTEFTQAGNLSNPLAAKTVASSASMFNMRCESSLFHTSSASSSPVSPMKTGPVTEPLDQASKSLYLTNRGNILDLPNENGTSSPSTIPAFNGNTNLFGKITTKNQSSESLLNLASHPKTSLPTSCSLPVPFSPSTVAATTAITPLTSASAAHIPFGKSLLSTKAAGVIDPTASESSITSATDKQSLLSSNVPSSQLKASLPDKTFGVSTIDTKSKELDLLASVSTSTFGFSSSEYSVSALNTQFSQSQTSSSTNFASLSTSLGTPSLTEPIAPTESTVGDSVHLDNISSKSQPATTTLPTPLEVKSPPAIENNLHAVNGGSRSLATSVSQPSISSPAAMLSTTTEKDKGLDASLSQEDEMDEEAPDTSTTLSLGSLGVFGLGTTSSAPKPSPFGGSFLTATSGTASSPFTFSTSPGEPFHPASFSLPSAAQPVHVTSQQPAVSGGGFGGFGQQTQLGVGQKALGSVLGSFGQSRQIGSGMPGTGFPSGGISPPANTGGFASAAAGGFAAASASTGGFASAAGGGFAAAHAKSGGFAALAQGSGGFGAGFASGGFASFGGNQGGFSGFAGDGSTSSTGKLPPASLLTQMRK